MYLQSVACSMKVVEKSLNGDNLMFLGSIFEFFSFPGVKYLDQMFN